MVQGTLSGGALGFLERSTEAISRKYVDDHAEQEEVFAASHHVMSAVCGTHVLLLAHVLVCGRTCDD